jgi:hypothetical protein
MKKNGGVAGLPAILDNAGPGLLKLVSKTGLLWLLKLLKLGRADANCFAFLECELRGSRQFSPL